MAYNTGNAVDYRYLRRYLRAMRRKRYRRERMGLCLLLFCAAVYLGFAGAYREAFLVIEEDHHLEYALPGSSLGHGSRLQVDISLREGKLRITRESAEPAEDTEDRNSLRTGG